jgi:hypothetical protein
MSGLLVEVRKIKANGGNIVAEWTDSFPFHFYKNLEELEKQGKALCIHNGGGYPYIYSAKTSDVMPLIEKELNDRPDVDKNGFSIMVGYSNVPDIPAITTRDKSEIPFCSSDETLIIELWDLS